MLFGVHLNNFIAGEQQIPDQAVLVCHTNQFLQKRHFQLAALRIGLSISFRGQQGKNPEETSRGLLRRFEGGIFTIFWRGGQSVAVGQKWSALFIANHILLSRGHKQSHKMDNSIKEQRFGYNINMIATAQIENKLRDLDNNPEILRQSKGKQEIFMKEWLCTGGTETERKEFSYVWSLIHGWEMEVLSSKSTLFTTQTQANSQKLFRKEVFSKFINIDMKNLLGEGNVVQYVSKGEMVIKFQNNLILINPSQAYEGIGESEASLILVLTEANICQILDLFRLPTKKAKLITTQAIYRKIKTLSAFLAENQRILSIPTTYLLKPDEYFQYGKIIWLMRENCWFQHSYDLHISLPHTRQAFLIESHKLDQTKLIYYGWKKNLIIEANYQKYIRQWERTIIRAAKQPFIIDALPPAKKEKVDWYLSFIEKQLIDSLSSLQQDHLFACCEVVTLIPNQIITKKGYRCDYLYILLQGSFQIREPLPHLPANPHKLYGLSQLKDGQELYSFTLASTTGGTIMRLDKGNVMFHLYDLFH